jgi:glycosyltransferase involved in cell wall biosynthesis
MSSKCPVSVVIPCYCCSKTLERALLSAVEQTAVPEEIILVDDASPDEGETRQKIEELCEKYALRCAIRLVFLDKNRGPGGARNAGWDVALQPLIAFLDADDSWHPRKIELQYHLMQSYPEIILSGHHCLLPGALDVPVVSLDHLQPQKLFGLQVLLTNPFSVPTVMLRREIPFRFKENMYAAEDYQLWMEIVLSGGTTVRLDIPLTRLHKAPYGEAGLSSRLWEMEKGTWAAYRSLVQKKLLNPSWLLFLIPFSFAKYLRRVCTVAIRQMYKS